MLKLLFIVLPVFSQAHAADDLYQTCVALLNEHTSVSVAYEHPFEILLDGGSPEVRRGKKMAVPTDNLFSKHLTRRCFSAENIKRDIPDLLDLDWQVSSYSWVAKLGRFDLQFNDDCTLRISTDWWVWDQSLRRDTLKAVLGSLDKHKVNAKISANAIFHISSLNLDLSRTRSAVNAILQVSKRIEADQ